LRKPFGSICLASADGMIDFEIERLGDVRLYLIGNILAGGINRGLETGLEECSLTVERLEVDKESLTIQYKDVRQTVSPMPTATRPRKTPIPTATGPRQTPTATSAYELYVVQEGDSLSKIAKRFGVTVEDLIEANRARYPSLVTDRGTIEIGWELRIPKR
jgi:LysM repeat protein